VVLAALQAPISGSSLSPFALSSCGVQHLHHQLFSQVLPMVLSSHSPVYYMVRNREIDLLLGDCVSMKNLVCSRHYVRWTGAAVCSVEF
jgi:hypothetical protein